ncbi:hypothetical protein [Glutamicibacter sp. V16R2B1]|uniref:hypothetical protein n=1 Tax=Glutamicibacter sp. V16R2B1 TaxID=2036207 RepID=UPI0010FF5E31|nr:hypothetical protein [Glutamicibacter sp. V16R2B1]TLK56316.1 hypothetical protein FDN03_02380 [Glutamicibacter sp. V16R2B1]
MATKKQVTEPAEAPATDQQTEPARVYDPNKSVKVYDKNTGEVLRRTVPETWLDGRFPNLKAAPSNKKEGK